MSRARRPESQRKREHRFIPNSGWPELCLVCNCGKDDTRFGKFIHKVEVRP